MSSWTTNSFGLKSPSSSDREEIADLYADEQLMAYISEPLTRKQAINLADSLIKESKQEDAVIKLVSDNETGQVLGLISLYRRDALKAVEFGIMIKPEYQQSGLGRIALLTVLSKASEYFGQEIELFTSFINADNFSANEGARKLGFTQVPNDSQDKRHIYKNRWDVRMEQIK